MGGALHAQLEAVDPRLEEDVGEDEGDGGDEAQRCGEQGEANVAGLAGDAAAAFLNVREGADHADDGSEQADHGGDLGDGQDGRQQEVEVGQDLQLDGVGHGPPDGGEALLVRLQAGDIEPRGMISVRPLQ